MAKFKVGDYVMWKSVVDGNGVGKVTRVIDEDHVEVEDVSGGVKRRKSISRDNLEIMKLTLKNAARSRNAVVQKALNAVARNGAMAALDSSEKCKIKSIASGMPCSFMDGGDSLSGVIKHSKRPFLYIDFDVSKSEIDGKPYYEWYVHAWNRTRKWERNGGQYKIEDAVSAAAQAMRGAKQMIEKWAGGVPLNADTSVLRETAVNGAGYVDASTVVIRPGDAVVFKTGYRSHSNDDDWLERNGDTVREVRGDEVKIGPSANDWAKIKDLMVWHNSRTTNAVVAKALNASRVARNAISGYLPNGMPAAQASAELGALADKLVREADNVAYGKHGRRGVSAMVDRRSGSISDMRVHVQLGSAYRELEGKVDSELKALGRKYGAKDAHVFFWKGDAELTLTF